MGKTKNKKKHNHGKKHNGSEGEGTKGDGQQERLSKEISSECKRQQVDSAAASESSTHVTAGSETSRDEVSQGIDREAVSKDLPETASPVSDNGSSEEQTGSMPQGTDSESIRNDQTESVFPEGSSETAKDQLSGQIEGASSSKDAESLDQQLEETAARRNLSVLNVKSILHHVLKDKRVLALVQRRTAEAEGEELQGEWEDLGTYEPKLTRSRVRKAVASGVAEGSLSPEKLASFAKATRRSTPAQTTEEQRACGLLEVTFPEEESSDEEYNPAAEGSSEEEEEEESGGEGEGEATDTGHSLSAREQLQPQEGSTLMCAGSPATPSPVPQDSAQLLKCAETGATGSAANTALASSRGDFSVVAGTDPPTCVPMQQVPTAAVTCAIEMPSIDSITTAALITSTASQLATSVPTANPLYEPPPYFSMSSTSQEPVLPSVPTLQLSTTPISQQGPVFPAAQSSSSLAFPATQPSQQGPGRPALPISQQDPVLFNSQTFQQGTVPHIAPVSQQDPVLFTTQTSQPVLLPSVPPIPQHGPLLATGSNSSHLLPSAADAAMQEAAALLASLSDVILSPPRPMQPRQVLQSAIPAVMEHGASSILEQSSQQNEEEIAKRTRSKHPLTDTSISAIEASFIPPDLEDPPTPMELDDEDLQWQNWLADLMNTSATGGESAGSMGGAEEGEDQDDGEYNYLADQQEEEKEEFRNDRAVRISQKEVAELLDELLNPSDAGVGGLLADDGVDLVSAYLLDSLGIQAPLLTQGSASDTPQQAPESPSQHHSPPSDHTEQPGCYLSTEQTVQLWTQLQQHYQLLMQTFVLSRYEPSLVFLSQIAAQAVDEMTQWCQEAREGKGSPVWCIPELQEGNELIRKLDPANHNAVELHVIAASGNPPRVPEAAQDIFMNHHLFWNYPKLLPGAGFAPMTSEASGGKYFTTQEEHLLVLGMDHYGPSAWSLIQENLLPTKTVKQLQLRVKNQCSKRTADNVIKHYKRTKKVKIPFKDDKDEHDLPQWILQYHKKRVDKEKEDGKKREKELQDSRKMAKLLDGVLKTAVLKPKSACLPADTTPHPNSSTPGNGSKRNLTGEMIQVDSEAKKLRFEEPTGNKIPASNQRHRPSTRAGRAKGGKRVKQGNKTRASSCNSSLVPKSPQRPVKHSPVKILQVHNPGRIRESSASPTKSAANSKANMEYLLLAAGLEISDPAARYACNYLTEVKATLADREDGAYDDFLKVLMSAKRENWTPSKVYRKVQLILQPWPHLLKLFTEFLEPHDCIEANVLGDKYELESVKSFVGKLQSKFASAPLKLDEIMKRLTQFDDSDVTREKVRSSVLPLIKAHEELVDELRRFLFQLAPPARPDDVYEEIILGSDCEKEPDEFEEAILPDSPPPNLKEAVPHFKAPCNIAHDKAVPHVPLSRTVNTVSTGLQVTGIHKPLSEPDKQEVSHEICIEAVNKAQVDFVPPENCKAPNRVDPTAEGVKDGEMDSSTSTLKTVSLVQEKEERTAVQQMEWTKDEDRLILQSCAKAGLSPEVMNKVTSQLNRTQDEVKTRYKLLFTLFHSTFSKHNS